MRGFGSGVPRATCPAWRVAFRWGADSALFPLSARHQRRHDVWEGVALDMAPRMVLGLPLGMTEWYCDASCWVHPGFGDTFASL